MNNILVFGGSGFIGKHLINKLSASHDNNITVFRLGSDKIGLENCQQVVGNVLKPKDVDQVLSLKQYDYIYYLISRTIPKSSWQNPLKEVSDNLIPFMHLLDKVSKRKIKKFIFLSSGGTIYGLKSGVISENSSKNPFSPHGIFKYTMEQLLEHYFIKNNLNYDIYRVSNVYGPGQNTSLGLGVINTWLEKIINNEPITLFGDGTNVRDYLYVEDLAKILTLSVTKTNDLPRIMNLGSGVSVSLIALAEEIKHVVVEKVNITFSPSRSSDNKVVILDNKKLMTEFKLDAHVFISLPEGIKKTYDFMKSQIQIKK